MKRLLIAIILFSGCVPDVKAPEPVPVVELSVEAKKVQALFKAIESEEDRLLIYKLFSGSADYLKNAKTLQTSGQFDPILGRVQSSYGWNREKYVDFTTAVSDYLVAKGYDVPRKLDSDENRKWLRDIFEELAAATNE